MAEYTIDKIEYGSNVYNLESKDLKNLVDGSATGSIRSIGAAEEDSNYTMGAYAVAEGNLTTASGIYSHAEGSNTIASGNYSHAEGGGGATASGNYSHAEGNKTTASGQYSHAQNLGTKAQRYGQTVIGTWNVPDTQGADTTQRGKYALIIGNGTNDGYFSNALTVEWNGNVWCDGDIEDGAGNVLSNKIEASDVPTNETDPTVPSWAKASTKPSYTASEVGAVPTTRKVNNKALSSDITLTTDDIGLSVESYAATLPSTFAASTFVIRKYGAVVTITINNVTKAKTGSNELFTLPAGWRPPGTTMTMLIAPAASISTGQTNLSLRFDVKADGVVELYNYRSSAITGNTNAGGVLTYIATQ